MNFLRCKPKRSFEREIIKNTILASVKHDGEKLVKGGPE